MKKLIVLFLFISSQISFGQVPSGCGSTNWPTNVPLSTGNAVAFTVPLGSGTGWTYKWVVTPSLQISSGQGTNTAYIKGASGATASGIVYVTRFKDGVSACADLNPVTINCVSCPPCSYTFAISDNYIDGTQSGSNTAGLNVTGGNTFPAGTTYSWTITRQDGTIQYYPATTAQTRFVTTTFNNRITDATVVASYLNCTKVVTKKFMCAIPHSDIYGICFPECIQCGSCQCSAAKLSNQKAKIIISPNPTSSIIKFEGKNLSDYKISIFNIKGTEIIKDSKIDQNINMEKQAKGIYLYIITDETGFKQEGKIIKE